MYFGAECLLAVVKVSVYCREHRFTWCRHTGAERCPCLPKGHIEESAVAVTEEEDGGGVK